MGKYSAWSFIESSLIRSLMIRDELDFFLLDFGNRCTFFDGLPFPDNGLCFGVVGDDSSGGTGSGRTVVFGEEFG